MKMMIQRVNSAQVVVDEQVVGQIDQGFLVFVGITHQDDENIAEKMCQKMMNLRIFDDDNGKINRSLKDVGGNILCISQFTLYADCKKGNRPSFLQASSPEHANVLYEYILTKCKSEFPNIQKGVFGADMTISLVNDGPFTIFLDSEEIL